jgi:hypothetical protein
MKMKITLFVFALMFGLNTNWAASSSEVYSGIEPIVASEFNGEDPPSETESVEKKIRKKEKTSFGKMFAWVKKKANKTLAFFGIGNGDDANSFSIIGFLLGFLLSLVGVLLAYLLLDSPGIRGAWIGFLVSLLLYGIGVFTIF